MQIDNFFAAVNALCDVLDEDINSRQTRSQPPNIDEFPITAGKVTVQDIDSFHIKWCSGPTSPCLAHSVHLNCSGQKLHPKHRNAWWCQQNWGNWFGRSDNIGKKFSIEVSAWGWASQQETSQYPRQLATISHEQLKADCKNENWKGTIAWIAERAQTRRKDFWYHSI